MVYVKAHIRIEYDFGVLEFGEATVVAELAAGGHIVFECVQEHR